MNNLTDERAGELDRFNAVLKEMTGYWIVERKAGEGVLYPPVWEP